MRALRFVHLLLLMILLTSLPDITCGVNEAFAQTYQPILEDRWFSNTRNTAGKDSVAPFVDGLDAAQLNPAGIGGISKHKKGFLRSFHFPYMAGGGNASGQAGVADALLGFGFTGLTLKPNLDLAAAGDPVYGQGSFLLGVEMGRFIMAPIFDMQYAATPNAEESTSVDLKYRKMTGILAGFSISGFGDKVTLGISTLSATYETIDSTFTSEEMESETSLDAVLGDRTSTYSAMPLNLGFHWNIQSLRKYRPVLSVSWLDFGGTKWETSSEGAAEIKKKENAIVAFGMSPHFNRWSRANVAIGASKLTDKDETVDKKFSFTTELELGPFGGKSYFTLRTGVDASTTSYGLQFNVGMFGFQATAYQVDIGTDVDGKHVAQLDDRQSALVWLDLNE